MSYKLHEAVCFDSTKYRLNWRDDFWGDSVNSFEWASVIDGAGSIAVVDAQDGGVVRLTTGNVTDNDTILFWGDKATLLASKQVSFETRVKLNHTTNISINFALFYDGTHFMHFRFDDVGFMDTTWKGRVRDPDSVTIDTLITPDTDYHIFRFECIPSDELHFFIDDVEPAASPITSDIPTQHLQVWLNLRTKEDAVKSVDIDYVSVRQER